MLEISKGAVPGHYPVDKFGQTTNADAGVQTDLWDRADATYNQPVWLAPTAARLHDIVSSDANDDGSPVGTGARTIRIWGLKTWDLAETSEDITMDGTTPVTTANSYVIIHRMRVLTSGTAGPNVGDIKATAATDVTVTAMIKAGLGTTHMAIYGVPSTQKMYLTHFFANIDSPGGNSIKQADVTLRVSLHPDVDETQYVVEDEVGLVSFGTSLADRIYGPYPEVVGPAIVKIEVVTDVNDMDVFGGFDGILVDN